MGEGGWRVEGGGWRVGWSPGTWLQTHRVDMSRYSYPDILYCGGQSGGQTLRIYFKKQKSLNISVNIDMSKKIY